MFKQKIESDVVSGNIFGEPPMLDVTGAPKLVELLIDKTGKKVWVNVNGVCRLRAQNIENLVVQDDRNAQPGEQILKDDGRISRETLVALLRRAADVMRHTPTEESDALLWDVVQTVNATYGEDTCVVCWTAFRPVDAVMQKSPGSGPNEPHICSAECQRVKDLDDESRSSTATAK